RADLRDARLRDADLSDASMSAGDLSFADLEGVDFSRAHLRGANLSGTRLVRANMTRTDLSHSDLRSSVLREAIFRESDLRNARMSGSIVVGTVFGDVDLAEVLGLQHLIHEGPSIIGIDTIYRSKGKISERFLRNAGVPSNLITYMKSLTGEALDFYSCFISYSTRDQPFADRLHADLQANGVRCWFSPHDVQAGKKLHEQIDEAIRVYDRLLLILSPSSMSSEWVKTEIAKARNKEMREGRRALFPLRICSFAELRAWKCFDADTGKDSAREIREYFIPDFSNWKDHDSYQTAFQKLLRDLKADATKTTST